jgi:alpha-amylase/alpha-mannosidase (GH57 family)
MVYLALIFHMHQPYYRNLLTQEAGMPWVRLHATKDYLDMLQILDRFPNIQQTINVVPSLLEQIEDYCRTRTKETHLWLSTKPADDLNDGDKNFILKNFFSVNKERILSLFPRYYELYTKKQSNQEFTTQDFLDLQVLFNLAWIDPSFRENIPELKTLVLKARFYCERDKQTVIEKQIEIMKAIIPAYRDAASSERLEITVTPYYHPILPLLYNTNIAKEASPKTTLPKIPFSHPEDAQAQINDAVAFYHDRLKIKPAGMWPSEESVSEDVMPLIAKAGIKWVVTDEEILFKSLNRKKRDTDILYQPHFVKTKEGNVTIVFRDRNLSDLIGFVYHKMEAKPAVDDFMLHLENIAEHFKDEDVLVTIAMDGENAWEFYPNDGHDFLELLYKRLSESTLIKTTTVRNYLKKFPAKFEIKELAPGSWIYGNFGKWIGNPHKVKAWEWLAMARSELRDTKLKGRRLDLAWKQMHILEGSDWFWWYGEDPDGGFDLLYRTHLTNFYKILGAKPPEYLQKPLTP